MIKNSIFVKISILFLVAIIGLSAFSYYFIREEIQKEILENQLKYNQFLATINQLVRFGGNIDLIEKYLYELDLRQITENKTLEKFANTPSSMFILNGDVNGVKIPSRLDKQYYIDLAKKRIIDKFGLINF